jgi:hypothetical protein
MRTTKVPALGVLLALVPFCAFSATDQDLAELRGQIEQMRKEYEARIGALEERLRRAEQAPRRAESGTATRADASKRSALDAAVAEAEALESAPTTQPADQSLWSRRVGGSDLRLLDISLNLQGAAGASSVGNAKIKQLEGGEHDPRRRGFTFQQAELGFKGAVDPYFIGETYIVASEEGVELEEAFFTTTSLPSDLQLEGGYFLTEFGLNNPTHPHSWSFIDQPFINTRFFSGEGQRGAGFRLSQLMSLPWYSEFSIGAQDPTNSTMISFEGSGHSHEDEEENGHGEEDGHGDELIGDGLGGFARVRTDDVDGIQDLAWLVRWVNGWDFNPATSAQLGVSGLYGPNTTGDDGETWIVGADFKLKWRPASNFRGWPYLAWTSEMMYRDYEVDPNNPSFVSGQTGDLKDWGLRTQLVYGFRPRWEAGLRFEYGDGNDKGVIPDSEDVLRDKRYRISPMLAWRLSEYSRFRLQYNYDDADYLSDPAHMLWLGFDVSLGAHPAHKY